MSMNSIRSSAIYQYSWLIIAVGLVAMGIGRAEGVAVNTIEDNALRNARGIVTVNIASGDTMTQFNGLGIALSDGVWTSALVKAHQHMEANSLTEESLALAVTHIRDGSFSNVKGLLAINQASGRGNAQANGVAMALGIEGEALADSELSQSLPDASMLNGGQDISQGVKAVLVEDTAFNNTHGVVQVNQAAGSWNATTNSFALRFSGDADF